MIPNTFYIEWCSTIWIPALISLTPTRERKSIDLNSKSVYFLLRNWIFYYITYPIIVYLTANSIGITLTRFRIANSLTITATQLTIASNIIISWYRIVFNYVTTSFKNSSSTLRWDGIKGQVILSLVIIGITFRFGTWVGDNIDLNVDVGKMVTISDAFIGTPLFKQAPITKHYLLFIRHLKKRDLVLIFV